MTNDAATPAPSQSSWSGRQVYGLAGVCLVVGLAIGYLFRGSQPATSSTASVRPMDAGTASSAMNGGMPTLEQMKHMAEKKVEPLLAKLQWKALWPRGKNC